MPPTPLLHQLMNEVDAYMEWWVHVAWWHFGAVWIALVILWLALLGGILAIVTAASQGSEPRASAKAWPQAARKL